MIIDWYKNGEDIFRTNKLKEDDPGDNKHKIKQEIMYINFLRKVKGMSNREALERWLHLENGSAADFIEDDEQLDIQFRARLKKADLKRYQDLNCEKPLEPIMIYKSEVDFINSIDAPLWVRQYWGCLLFNYKFMSQVYKRVQKTKELNAWSIRQTEFKSKNYGGDCQDKIAQYRIKSKKVVIKDYPKMEHDKYPTYVPVFVVKNPKNNDEVVGTYGDVNEIQDFLKNIKPCTRICARCGKEFVVSNKTKRDICDRCYHLDIKARDRARKKTIPEENRILL